MPDAPVVERGEIVGTRSGRANPVAGAGNAVIGLTVSDRRLDADKSHGRRLNSLTPPLAEIERCRSLARKQDGRALTIQDSTRPHAH